MPELDPKSCRGRQRRLIELMHASGLDLVVVTQREHVQWLTGVWLPWFFSPAAALDSAGRMTLVAPVKGKLPSEVAADEVATYEANWHSTLRNDQRAESSRVLAEALGAERGALARGASRAGVRRIGVEFSTFGPHLANRIAGELVDVEPDLYRLRRRKDDDELAMIRQAIDGTARMYERAREIIRPGVTELEVFNDLQAAAVVEFGEPLTGTGNDYQCGSRGGPPRNRRPAEAGELYILDLGPAYRGYFADNARTIAVTTPTEEQLEAWSFIERVFAHVETEVRPGKSAQELFHEAQAILDEAPIGVFNHHLGHGFGLFPHEAPHLNPHWSDMFEFGDTFTVEPGLYDPRLSAGMRIENNYRVADDGVELLTDFSRAF